MKIAVAVNGNDMDSLVAEYFEKSSHLLIFETDDASFTVFKNDPAADPYGSNMAGLVIGLNCECLITGMIEKHAFEMLAARQITRYFGNQYAAGEAIALMEVYALEFIRDYHGAENFPHYHEQGNCNCGIEE